MSSKPQLDAIKDLDRGAHVCFLYETEEEHRALLTQYLRHGLDRGEKVLYVADARTAGVILEYLRDDGVTVEPYLTSGQLDIRTASDTYLQGGVFDPNKIIASLRRETERALTEGYKALRGTGEMTWALRGLPGSQRLMEYESKLNTFFSGSQCLGLCQYDRRYFDVAMVEQVLSTHPIVVVGPKVYDLHYTPPDVREHEGEREAFPPSLGKKPGVRICDGTHPVTLDRHEARAQLLAVSMILVMAASLALLAGLYFSHVLNRSVLFEISIGVCTSSLLLLGYLLNRQHQIRQLRKQLAKREGRIIPLRKEKEVDLLNRLAALGNLQPWLAVKLYRSTRIQKQLSAVIVSLKPSRVLDNSRDVSEAFGDAAEVLLASVRQGDSIYRLSPSVFSIVLLTADGADANRVAERVAEGLSCASEASGRFSFEIRAIEDLGMS